MNKTLKTVIGSFALLCMLLMFGTANAAESATGDVLDLAPTPGDAAPTMSPPPPFTKFNVFASGVFTTSNSLSTCTSAGVACSSGACFGCLSFSGLPLKGLAGTKISGQLIIENNYVLGQCFQTHGSATATGANFAINFGITGQLCEVVISSVFHNDLPFTGSYVVLGGQGASGHALGTGSFTSDFSDSYAPITSSLSMNGTIQKAK
jgi:hypothetical protein